MNYKEKYKEALKSMRDLYNKMKYLSSIDALATTATLENAFPELKESEDERIRKTVLKMITDMDGGYPFEKYGIIKKDAIAWLEKQGEKKPAWSEEDEDIVDIAIRIIQNGGDDCAGILDSNKALRWLKSLNPQNRWKPSKEQMSMLLAVLNDSNNISSESVQIALKSLYQDLLKL